MTENQTSPIPLDYPDERPIGLDVAAIRGAGLRVRRRRRITAAATAGALVVAVAAGVLTLRGSSGPPSPVSGEGPFGQIADALAEHPPLLGPVVVDSTPKPWTTVAWPAAGDQFCYATFRTPAAGSYPVYQCQDIESELSDASGHVAIGLPIPVVSPIYADLAKARPGEPDVHPFIGLVRGPAARVAVKADGHSFSAAVTPLTTADGSEVGVFQVWITTGASWDDDRIEGMVAYDGHGAVIARQGRWKMPTKPDS